MRKATFISISASAFFIFGCVARQPLPTYEIRAPFDAAEAARLLADGLNTINGNAFMRQRGGGVVTCAGQTVLLIPATSYAQERVRALYGNTDAGINSARKDFTFVPDSPEYLRSVRTTKCDAQGNFRFERVADGSFFAMVQISWQVGYEPQGGNIMHRVNVSNGQTASIVMAP